MKIIGVTGNSGAGKTEVSKILKKKYNAVVIDADKIARGITTNNIECLNEIRANFGDEIICDNKLNRKKLSHIIYNNKTKRNLLNSITFKYILEEINTEINSNRENGVEYIIIDAPLLFESNLIDKCNIIIGIIADKSIKISRVKERDMITKDDVKSRLKAQKGDWFFKHKCNYIIKNNFSTLEELEKEISRLNISI